MTLSAPIDRTMPAFLVPQTPVTFARTTWRSARRTWRRRQRTVDQHPVPGLHLPLIANGSEGGERGVSNGRRLPEREAGRLRQDVVLRSARILGEGAPTPAEHLIARSKLLYAAADCLDLPGHVESRCLALWTPQAGHGA